uniref:Uncharacterized protein n=1 Tax=Manihot esculenta TaxID=3983 RepID=A0A2C9V2Q3_MANES
MMSSASYAMSLISAMQLRTRSSWSCLLSASFKKHRIRFSSVCNCSIPCRTP